MLSRIESQQIEAADFPLLADLLRAMIWLQSSLREKELSITRLRNLFGIKTETAKKLSELLDNKKKDKGNKPDKEKDEKVDEEGASGGEPPWTYQLTMSIYTKKVGQGLDKNEFSRFIFDDSAFINY